MPTRPNVTDRRTAPRYDLSMIGLDMGPSEFCIFLALLLFALAICVVITGKALGRFRIIDRNRDPSGFWVVQITYIALGVYMFYLAYRADQLK